jgi:guanine nucleotide-binding protein G(i) subunit alpha
LLKNFKYKFNTIKEEHETHIKNEIVSNIIETMKIYCKFVIENDLKFENKINNEYSKAISKMSCSSPSYTSQTHLMITSLLEEKSIQKAMESSELLHVSDGVEHFIKNIKSINPENFTPDKKEMLRSRSKTCGIVEYEYEQLKIYDFGGQRMERKKWGNYLIPESNVFFMAALNEFDLLCYEDDSTNRLEESLNLFVEIINMKQFVKSKIYVIFTKGDILKKKIELNHDFENLKKFGFDGEITFDNILDFHKSIYKNKNTLGYDIKFYFINNLTDHDDFNKFYNEIGIFDKIIF